MTVETATYISQLDPTYPAAGDAKSEGDDHIRQTKGALRNTFVNLTATPVTPTSADLNTVAGAATTGGVGFNVATQASTDNSTKAASTAFVSTAVAAAAFAATLPRQSGNGGKVIRTDGATASWQYPGLTVTPVSGTTQTAVAGNNYVLNNVAATAVTMPTTLVAGDPVTISPNNGLLTNTVDFGAKTVRFGANTMTGVVTLDLGAPMQLVAIDTTTWMWL